MKDVRQTILDCHTRLMQSKVIDKVSSEDLEFRRMNGIDSLGIVALVLDVEEELEIELDDYLVEIRNCHTIGDMINVVNRAATEKTE